MTQDEFWQHIRAAARRDPEDHADRLAARLAKLPPDDILAFGRWWHLHKARSYTWKLWGAAYLVNGGCSDDGFEYFRDWLLLQGREAFEAAVADPESLAGLLDGEREVECECHPAYDAYSAAVGDDGFVAALQAKYPDLPDYPPLDRGWSFDDAAAMRSHYPKLFAAYVAGNE